MEELGDTVKSACQDVIVGASQLHPFTAAAYAIFDRHVNEQRFREVWARFDEISRRLSPVEGVTLHDSPELSRHPGDRKNKLAEGDQLDGGVAYYRILNHVLHCDTGPEEVHGLEETDEMAVLNCHLLSLCNKFVLNVQGLHAGVGAGPALAEGIRKAWFAPTPLARQIAEMVDIEQ